jgi:hypothetical protein
MEIVLLVGFFAAAFFITRFVNKAGGISGGC